LRRASCGASGAKMVKIAERFINSHYETYFAVSSAEGAGNSKIGFLKARRWRAFKKPILIMRIAESDFYHFARSSN